MAHVRSILIIGGSGFLGTHLARKFRDDYKVFMTFNKHFIKIPGVTTLPCSVYQKDWIKRIIYLALPDIIIYLAGHPRQSFYPLDTQIQDRYEPLYSTGVASVLQFSELIQSKFIYLSNPYVFDGKKGNYHENDTVLPNFDFGKTKLNSEKIIKNNSLNYLILRLSPIFGFGNGHTLTFLDYLRIKLYRNETCHIPHNESHSFIPIAGFIQLMQRLIDSPIKNKVFHYGGLTKLNFFEFTQAFAKRFHLPEERIIPIGPIGPIGPYGPSSLEENAFDFSLNSSQCASQLQLNSFFLEEGLDSLQQHLVT